MGDAIVRAGSVVSRLRAAAPTITSLRCGSDTTDGKARAPSTPVRIVTLVPIAAATEVLVVPRSMPTMGDVAGMRARSSTLALTRRASDATPLLQ